MWRSLVFMLLAVVAVLVEGGYTLSFAADVANTEEFASPESAQPQPVQGDMQSTQQAAPQEQQKNDAEDAQVQNDAPAAAPRPSQRGMRQQMRDAKRSQAPAVDNPDNP